MVGVNRIASPMSVQFGRGQLQIGRMNIGFKADKVSEAQIAAALKNVNPGDKLLFSRPEFEGNMMGITKNGHVVAALRNQVKGNEVRAGASYNPDVVEAIREAIENLAKGLSHLFP